MTGARYIESLKDGREVWLDGEKVQDVTTHPAFTGMVHELARIYDLQHTDTYRDQMTFISPTTGNRCSLSWLLPQAHEDLQKKRRNSEIWNEQCWGQLGRGPDILAPYIITLYDLRETLSALQHPRCDFGANVVNYYHYCLENDLFLTHALGDPQVDRGQQPQNEQRAAREDELVLHVVEETNEGITVHGAKQLATAAPISHETYVSLSATFVRRAAPACVLAFPSPRIRLA
jgi:aromatic ring hydroxylase